VQPASADPPQGGASPREVLDRVLGKGVVVDDFARVGLKGIDMITGRARVVVTVVETKLEHETDVRPKAA
jgi:hypothetical protein